MTPLEAVDRLSGFDQPMRARCFDWICLVRHGGEVFDTWPDCAAALLDLAGYLDECESDADLERSLREAHDLYLASEVIPIESIKARAVELLNAAIEAEAALP